MDEMELSRCLDILEKWLPNQTEYIKANRLRDELGIEDHRTQAYLSYLARLGVIEPVIDRAEIECFSIKPSVITANHEVKARIKEAKKDKVALTLSFVKSKWLLAIPLMVVLVIVWLSRGRLINLDLFGGKPPAVAPAVKEEPPRFEQIGD